MKSPIPSRGDVVSMHVRYWEPPTKDAPPEEKFVKVFWLVLSRQEFTEKFNRFQAVRLDGKQCVLQLDVNFKLVVRGQDLYIDPTALTSVSLKSEQTQKLTIERDDIQEEYFEQIVNQVINIIKNG